MKIFNLIILISILSTPIQSQNWNLYQHLNEARIENFGLLASSVSIKDDLLITGAWFMDGDPTNPVSTSGYAYLYEKDANSIWKLKDSLFSPNQEASGYFGFSTAIENRKVAIGAFNESHGNFARAGRVYLYDCSNNQTNSQTLLSENPENSGNYGSSLAMSNDFLLVGAHLEDLDANNADLKESAGAVYLYEMAPNGNYQFIQKLTASDRAEDDEFGKSIDIDNDRLIVGAAFHDDTDNFLFDHGAAYIFERQSDGTWLEIQKLESDVNSSFLCYGCAVSISGDWAMVGSNERVNNVVNAGAVYFYHRGANGNWEFKQKVNAPQITRSDDFGAMVQLKENIAIIGSPGDDEDEMEMNTINQAGAVYIFQKDANDVWIQQDKIVAGIRSVEDRFGIALDLDEGQIIVGSNYAENPENHFNPGTAYVYELEATNFIKEEKDQDLKFIQIGNNPSDGLLNIFNQIGHPLSGNLIILNTQGVIVSNENISIENNWEKDFSHLETGVYFIHFTSKNKIGFVSKWIKQ